MKHIYNDCGFLKNAGILLLAFPIACFFTGCGKEVADPEKSFFTPTEHIIALSASNMMFTMEVPHKGMYYNLSADSSIEFYSKNKYISFLIPLSEMEILSQALSDTVIFKWRKLDQEKLVYRADHCELRVFIGDQQLGLHCEMVCSIGNDRSTIEILNELAKAVSMEARTAFDTLIHSFEIGIDMNEKYFDPIRIDSLHLDRVDGFWIDTPSPQSINRNVNPLFRAPGFMDAIFIESLHRQMGFYIYLTKEAALQEMEIRSNSFQYSIHQGTPNEMNWRWWYDNESINYYGIYLNIRNTILYLRMDPYFMVADTLYHSNLDSVQYYIKEPAIKLGEMIENLSEYKQENE